MAISLVTYLTETLVFPGLVAIGLTFLTTYISRGSERKNDSTPRQVESDLHNEFLDSGLERYTPFLFFALYFNLAFLTANVALEVGSGSILTTIYATAVVCFLVALFITLLFELRFANWRYVAIGLAFALFGTVVIFSALQFGFAMGEATGTAAGSATGTGIVKRGTDILVPITLAGGAWVLAAIAFYNEFRGKSISMPFRVPNARAYNLFLGALVIGWAGVCLAVIHSVLVF